MTTTPNDPITDLLGHPPDGDSVFLAHFTTGRGNKPVNRSLGRQRHH